MSQVRWRRRAISDINRLYAFLKDKNSPAAEEAAATIRGAALLLSSSAHIGRPMGDDTGRRELFLPFGSGAYVLRYKLEGSTVVILRVWHSREGRPH